MKQQTKIYILVIIVIILGILCLFSSSILEKYYSLGNYGYSDFKKFLCENISQKQYREMKCTPNSDYVISNAHICIKSDYKERCE